MSKSKKKKPLSLPPEKKSLQNSGSSRVNVKIDGIQNDTINIAGSNSMNINNVSNEVLATLDELGEIFKNNLPQRNDVEYLLEIIAELKSQSSKSAEERNTVKIKQSLSRIGSYMGLATFTSSQADKAKRLFETIYEILLN